MKIGIDASRINLEQKTGTEWYSYYIVKNLLNIDQKNQYFLFSRKKLPKEFLKYKNVDNIVLDWPLKKFWTLTKLSLELKKYNLDLFFSPSHNLPVTKAKKIITWHDLGYEYFPNHYSKTQLLSLRLGAKGLNKADLIISPSLNTKNDIIKFYGIGEDRIFVIPHGIDFEKYNNVDINENVLNKYGIQEDFILYIGRLESKKNIVNLIKAYNKLRENNNDFQLVLVGKDGFEFNKIDNEIQRSIYKRDIKVIGWVSEEDKINLLKKTKLLCLISVFEGFGMSILEAMLCKVPVLMSDLEVFKEFGISDSCFTENNIGNISSKMEELLLNEDLRINIIDKNFELVQGFNWQKSAKETLEVFQRLI
jgi:glycosyltransferase involved in cell wall biosynthesis